MMPQVMFLFSGPLSSHLQDAGDHPCSLCLIVLVVLTVVCIAKLQSTSGKLRDKLKAQWLGIGTQVLAAATGTPVEGHVPQ